jgi:transposase InsO family protein
VEKKGHSQRRSCRLIGQPRATQRYEGVARPVDRKLLSRLKRLSQKHPRWGYRKMTKILKGEGWKVNRKKVYRLWVEAGLRVPPRQQRKKRRLGSGENSCIRRRPEYVGHVWSYDFVFDETADGRRLKWLTVLEEFSRFDLALEVERHFTSKEVIEVLDRLFKEYGPPAFIRSDNGPEFIAEAVQKWLEARGVGTLYIEPGSPWENGYVESFNGTLREELLDQEEFGNVLEAKMLAVQWRDDYNHVRPHSSLEELTPAAFMESKKNGFTTGRRSDDLEVPKDLGTPCFTPRLS